MGLNGWPSIQSAAVNSTTSLAAWCRSTSIWDSEWWSWRDSVCACVRVCVLNMYMINTHTHTYTHSVWCMWPHWMHNLGWKCFAVLHKMGMWSLCFHFNTFWRQIWYFYATMIINWLWYSWYFDRKGGLF